MLHQTNNNIHIDLPLFAHEKHREVATITYAERYLQNHYNVPAHRARLLAELSGMGGAI